MSSDQPEGIVTRSPAWLCLDQEDGDSLTLPLHPGRNVVGRAEDQSIRLHNSTVSEAHCEIEVQPQGTLVRDLNSTNGTYVDGVPVHEAALHSGQVLQVGDVRLVFHQADVCAPVVLTAGGEQEIISRGCAHHLGSRASWVCQECHRQLCGACVKQVRLAPGRTVALCQTCQGVCEQLAGGQAVRREPQTFTAGVGRAFVQPLRGTGLVLILAAAGLAGVLSLCGGRWGWGAFAMLCSMSVGAWMLAYLRQTMLAAAEGRDETTDWPEWRSQSLLEGALQFAAVYLASFGPWIICRVWLSPQTETMALLCHGLLVLGVCYFPMALLAVVIYEDVAAMNPLLILPSLLKVPLKYFSVCCVGAALAGAAFLAGEWLAGFRLPVVSSIVSSMVSTYAALVMARLMGWFYFCSRDELAWS